MSTESDTTMRVALAKIELYFPCVHSLKEKRHILHKIKDRVFADFRIPVSEVSRQDKWQRALLGFAVVGNDSAKLNALADKIVRRIEDFGLAETMDSAVEVINY